TMALHKFWDNLLGPSGSSPAVVIKTAKKLPTANPNEASDLDVRHWVDEGVHNATNTVYISPVGLGAGPFVLTKKYQKSAKALAKKQVALAGERLANILNAELK